MSQGGSNVGAPTSVDDLCAEALQRQLAGSLTEAGELYAKALQAAPRHALANHCFGMLRVQQGRAVDALTYLMAALEARPETADYWMGYLEGLLAARLTEDAGAALKLARHHGMQGPASDDFEQRLAAQLKAQSAASDEDRLLEFIKNGEFLEARALSRLLTARWPDRGLGWKVLGAMHWAEGNADMAVSAMTKATALLPQDAEAHSNLGTTLLRLQRFKAAESSLKTALAIDPQYCAAYAHLGDVYQLQGKYPEAEACIRAAIATRADADDQMVYSSLLFTLSHNPAVDPATLFAEHRAVGEILERGRAPQWQHVNSRHKHRTLQVGFVSADLYDHAVASFLEPIVAQLCRDDSLELHAYYNFNSEDTVNRRLRGYFKYWTDVLGWSHQLLASRVAADRIDILIDVSGHTAHNRLPTFARKVAPLQVSWLGYPGTTGLRAMDYFIADRHFLPPGRFDDQFTEKLVQLPAAAIYQAPESPPINALPALANRYLTFGSFNRLGKINASTLDVWATLLLALPDSRLVIGAMPDDDRRMSVADALVTGGIARERISVHSRGSMADYLKLHHHIDLCLDTLPYGGGTTTHHALWMGVPTLTIAGQTPSARQAAGILGVAGLADFVANDVSGLTDTARYWAHHLDELAAVRSGLRTRLLESPNRNPTIVARAFSDALRAMWARWCDRLPPISFEADAAGCRPTGAA